MYILPILAANPYLLAKHKGSYLKIEITSGVPQRQRRDSKFPGLRFILKQEDSRAQCFLIKQCAHSPHEMLKDHPGFLTFSFGELA